MSKSNAKQMAKGTNPRIASISSSNVFGTSSETTSKVRAKPKTTSLKASSLDGEVPRMRNAYFSFCITPQSAQQIFELNGGVGLGVAILYDYRGIKRESPLSSFAASYSTGAGH